MTLVSVKCLCERCLFVSASSIVIINDFDICYMSNVFVCVVSLSQPNSKVIINDFGIC